MALPSAVWEQLSVSPPNGIFVRFVQQTYGVDVSIVQWMKVGMPVVLLLMPLSWLLLTKVLFREQIQKIAAAVNGSVPN